jgi:hypothetical protein
MAFRSDPAQGGADTPRSLGSFATRSNKSVSSGTISNEAGPSFSAAQPIPIVRDGQPSPYLANEFQVASSPPPLGTDQRAGELSRSFRGMLPKSFGNDVRDTRMRDQSTRQQHDHQWTLFGQLLEDNGALRPRRASVATGAPTRPRASSHLRQPVPPPNIISGSSARRPLSARNRSSSPGTLPSREASLDLPPNPSSLSRSRLRSEDPPTSGELYTDSDSEDDPLLFGSASITAGSRSSTRRSERPGHSRQHNRDSSHDSGHHDDESSSDAHPTPTGTSRSWISSPTPLQKKVLKCSIAYTIGCLFTFVPALSNLLTDIVPLGSQQGPSPTGHMVATVGKLIY